MDDWLSGLEDAIDSGIGDIIAFLQWLLGELVNVFVFLYNLLAAVFQFFLGLAKTIEQFFVSIWEDFLKGIFLDVWHAIQAVHQWLENLLAPIIGFLKTVLKWVDWVYTTYIKPFLSILNHIRSFLSLLRSFGIKWAAELDNILGKVESEITGAFLKLQGYLNAVIGIVNSLADPLGLFRGPSFLMSMRRIAPGFMRGFTGLPAGFFFPSPTKGAPAGLGPVPPNFDPSNSTMNPPVSSYFNYDDGLGSFGGVDPGDTIDPDDADDVQASDFFDDDAYPDSPIDDPVDGLTDLQTAALAFLAAGGQS
jgi:hypothetical protein